MQIYQISVFLENKVGRLNEVTRVLADNSIDIRALSVADTTDFGILRLIVSNPDLAFSSLREAGFTVSRTAVIAIHLEDQPGALHSALTILQDKGVGVEYAYAFITRKEDDAYLILRVEDDAQAIRALQEGGVKLLGTSEVYGL